MDNDSPMRNEGNTFAAGVKTAALIVILGAIAAVVDHTFFIAPYESLHRVSDAPPAAAGAPTSGAFAVPEHLRTNASDVPEHVNAF